MQFLYKKILLYNRSTIFEEEMSKASVQTVIQNAQIQTVKQNAQNFFTRQLLSDGPAAPREMKTAGAAASGDNGVVKEEKKEKNSVTNPWLRSANARPRVGWTDIYKKDNLPECDIVAYEEQPDDLPENATIDFGIG